MGILDKFVLKGKSALVTGGAGPLYGRACTAALAEAGAVTYIASRNLEKCQRVAEEHQALGHDVRAAHLDQGEETSILRLRDHILEDSGHIDILVNNAVLHVMRGMPDGDASVFSESLKVNALGLFLISRAFGDAMAEDRGGAIINISSIYGAVGPDPTHYPPTMSFWQPDYIFNKAGMINLTRYFAAYYGPKGVRCNSIIPGGCFNNQDPVFVERYEARTYLGRMACPDDIKGVIVLLASDASAYITGANIAMDGGYTAK